MLVRASDCVLVGIDLQERLMRAMLDPDRVIANAGILLAAAGELNVPVVLTEQNRARLGPTVEALIPPPGAQTVEKMHFSCMRDAAFVDELRRHARPQAVLTGVEAHVCVLQTAAGLLAAGYEVFVLSDATASRKADSHAAALARLSASGAHIVTTEMVVFEWLERAGTPEFRALLPLLK